MHCKFILPDESSIKIRDKATALANKIEAFRKEMSRVLPVGTHVSFQIGQTDGSYFNGSGTVCKTQFTKEDSASSGLIVDVVEPKAMRIPFTRKSVGENAMVIYWHELMAIGNRPCV